MLLMLFYCIDDLVLYYCVFTVDIIFLKIEISNKCYLKKKEKKRLSHEVFEKWFVKTFRGTWLYFIISLFEM